MNHPSRLGGLRGAFCISGASLSLLLASAGDSSAATYLLDCPPEDETCAAIVERLETQQLTLEEIASHLEGEPTTPSEISGTVALSETDRAYLDDTRKASGYSVGIFVSLILGGILLWTFGKGADDS